jgi:hypothetical protein
MRRAVLVLLLAGCAKSTGSLALSGGIADAPVAGSACPWSDPGEVRLERHVVWVGDKPWDVSTPETEAAFAQLLEACGLFDAQAAFRDWRAAEEAHAHPPSTAESAAAVAAMVASAAGATAAGGAHPEPSRAHLDAEPLPPTPADDPPAALVEAREALVAALGVAPPAAAP